MRLRAPARAGLQDALLHPAPASSLDPDRPKSEVRSPKSEAMPFIEVTALNKRYRVGTQDIHVLRDLRSRRRRRRDGRDRRRQRRRQEHAAASARRPRSSRVRTDRRAGARSRRNAGRRTGGVQECAGRVRLPVPPSAAGVLRHRERGNADAHRASAGIGGARPPRGRCSSASGSASASIIGPRCFLAESSSASRWRGRW